MSDTHTEAPLADDLLRGVEQIAAFIGEPVRRTYYALEIGAIPAGKHVGRWVASRRVLQQHFAELTRGDAAA